MRNSFAERCARGAIFFDKWVAWFDASQRTTSIPFIISDMQMILPGEPFGITILNIMPQIIPDAICIINKKSLFME